MRKRKIYYFKVLSIRCGDKGASNMIDKVYINLKGVI